MGLLNRQEIHISFGKRGYKMFEIIMETELKQARIEHKNIPIGIVSLKRIYDELTEKQRMSLDESFRIVWENIRRN